MPQYRVIVSERHSVHYLVDADSPAEAKKLWEQGDAPDSPLVSDDIVGSDVVDVRLEGP